MDLHNNFQLLGKVKAINSNILWLVPIKEENKIKEKDDILPIITDGELTIKVKLQLNKGDLVKIIGKITSQIISDKGIKKTSVRLIAEDFTIIQKFKITGLTSEYESRLVDILRTHDI